MSSRSIASRRGRRAAASSLTPSPVRKLSRTQHNIPVCTPKSLKNAEAQAAFAAWNADVAVVAAYGLILPEPVLAAPRLGCINIHASLLPRWRGAAPIQRAIMAGDSVTGVTIMQMDAGLDTGAMLLQGTLPITDATTAGALHDSLAALGATLILRVLDATPDGTLPAMRQPAEVVTHAAKIDKAETVIDFSKPARAVLRHIHGLSPAPGAWFAHGPERIKVLAAEAVALNGEPGTVIDDRSHGRLRVRRGAAAQSPARRPRSRARGGVSARLRVAQGDPARLDFPWAEEFAGCPCSHGGGRSLRAARRSTCSRPPRTRRRISSPSPPAARISTIRGSIPPPTRASTRRISTASNAARRSASLSRAATTTPWSASSTSTTW